ncbi:MAG TPA: hypothetical protein VLE73_02610 [Candidatus Saccharimonadales bacterium]|nr:hypothetical protein [Candidatus Saccharimonadales bacterium]
MSHAEPQTEVTYLRSLKTLLQIPKNDKALFQAIVNAPFHDIVQATRYDLGIVVLLLVNKKAGTIDRIALSKTPQAEGAVKMSEKPFHTIKIPVGHAGNIIAETIAANKPRQTDDWQYLFAPAMSVQAAHFNQAGAGIECSYVYPLTGARSGGALIFSYYQPVDNIHEPHKHFMQHYCDLVVQALRG